MQGIMEKIWENTTQGGDKYWTVIISGGRYSVWDKTLLEALQPGDAVDFLFTQSGQYRKICQLRRLPLHRDSSSHPEERERHIIRMSSVRAAAHLLEGARGTPENKAQAVLDVARAFETYILGSAATAAKREEVAA